MTSYVCDFLETGDGLALTIRSDSNPRGETLCLAKWEGATLTDFPVEKCEILMGLVEGIAPPRHLKEGCGNAGDPNVV